ncbi:hypothetical protein C8Q77DRAFT_1019570, partial [Trametes polyzona]
MRINGTTRDRTCVDEETGSILLRRLHPRIANYNDLVLYVMQCNMELKHIGSGEAAKALLYYITDYITKASLPMHVGLGVLSYAIQRVGNKYPQARTNMDTAVSRGALTIAVNRMMSRQEISHQQVMGYLIGGGDVYRSHTFRVLYWGGFDRLFRLAFMESNMESSMESETIVDLLGETNTDEDSFSIAFGHGGSISSSNQQQDYMLRSKDPEFEKMCLYDFVGLVEKIQRAQNGVNNYSIRGTQPRRGRPATLRGTFMDSHSQFQTHMLRKRVKWTVPVVLGERIPRSDRGADEKNMWARMMLILFIPWRNPHDLRDPGEDWTSAFERQKYTVTPAQNQIISNMNVLSECRDVRDSHRNLKRAEALALLRNTGLADHGGSNQHGNGDEDFDQMFELFRCPTGVNAYNQVTELGASQGILDHAVGNKTREMIDACFNSWHIQSRIPVTLMERNGADISREVTDQDEGLLISQAATMRVLKRQRRPCVDNQPEATEPRNKRQRYRAESVTISSISHRKNGSPYNAGTVDADPILTTIDQVVHEMHLSSNEEQERAFRIVGEHMHHGSEQLLMHIAGVGGTGKSHVIRAIRRLFELLG